MNFSNFHWHVTQFYSQLKSYNFNFTIHIFHFLHALLLFLVHSGLENWNQTWPQTSRMSPWRVMRASDWSTEDVLPFNNKPHVELESQKCTTIKQSEMKSEKRVHQLWHFRTSSSRLRSRSLREWFRTAWTQRTCGSPTGHCSFCVGELLRWTDHSNYNLNHYNQV